MRFQEGTPDIFVTSTLSAILQISFTFSSKSPIRAICFGGVLLSSAMDGEFLSNIAERSPH